LEEDIFRTDNSIKPYEKLMIDAVIAFMKSKFGFNATIVVKKKDNVGMIGDIVLNNNSVNLNKFTLHYNPSQGYPSMIKSLIHELTHVKQVSSKELQPSADYKSLVWNTDYVLSVRDYIKTMKNMSAYKELPWEKEAYSNMNSLYDEFINSPYWTNLRGKDKNMDFIINNL
jgi:hypothetical protein